MVKVENKYYVYVHRRKDTNEVFYVGKGSGYRHLNKDGRNRWWKAVVEKCGFYSEFIEEGMSEQCAFDLEVELIKFYKDCGHKLCNITSGGEGSSGVVRKPLITDGTLIDFNLDIPRIARDRTKRWVIKYRLALTLVISNLMLSSKVYYPRGRSKTEKTAENTRGINNYKIIYVVSYLVALGLATTCISKTTDGGMILSHVSPTELFISKFKTTKESQ